MSLEGEKLELSFEVVAFRRAILSVSVLAQLGFKVVFNSDGGHIVSPRGMNIQMKLKEGLYSVKLIGVLDRAGPRKEKFVVDKVGLRKEEVRGGQGCQAVCSES